VDIGGQGWAGVGYGRTGRTRIGTSGQDLIPLFYGGTRPGYILAENIFSHTEASRRLTKWVFDPVKLDFFLDSLSSWLYNPLDKYTK
jgi:hypothetical protein